jgi:putative ABC transport system substrate-binding protein
VREAYEDFARALGVQFQVVEVHGSGDIERAFQVASTERADALYIPRNFFTNTHRPKFVALAAEHRLPAMYGDPVFVHDGGLMAYRPSVPHSYRRAAYYVDRILKGAKPADLPIEQPREFDFVINLQTAQALGLTIPQHVLLQATEIIQ